MGKVRQYLQGIFIFCFVAIFSLSCSKDAIKEIINGDTDSEKIVKGLKSALNVGITNSVKKLSAPNGYLADKAVKILLPQEAQTTFEVLQIISSNSAVKTVLTGLDFPVDFENTLITLVNMAAEDAAPQAVGVFTTAITGMTISDGKNILFGADDAATHYLREKTYDSLQTAFRPSITTSLNTVEFAGETPVTAWSFYAEQNNKLADLIQKSSAAINLLQVTGAISADVKNKITSVKHVETNLSDYVTGKALNGLFIKVADEEYKIRTDASARVNSLLQEVFGQLDKK